MADAGSHRHAASSLGKLAKLLAAIVADPFNAAIDGLCHSADGLGPTESLLDPFAVPDRHGIALVPGRSGINRRDRKSVV